MLQYFKFYSLKKRTGSNDMISDIQGATGFSFWRISRESDLGEFGFGPYGAQDSYCHWLGEWKDGSEVAEILRNAAQ